VSGRMAGIRLPSQTDGQRRDGLWQTTCFEMFSRVVGFDGYEEGNFSPSSDWAAYVFAAYRQLESADYVALDPDIALHTTPDAMILRARAALAEGRGPWDIGLSAVIEETDGTKSYWALRHPPGPPDFHHPDCFALTLPAPGAP
jgi:hypothetical protein